MGVSWFNLSNWIFRVQKQTHSKIPKREKYQTDPLTFSLVLKKIVVGRRTSGLKWSAAFMAKKAWKISHKFFLNSQEIKI